MKREDVTVLILGILLLVAGLLIRYFIGKRRFKRRTFGGMQMFKNYNLSLIIPLIERFLMVLSVLFILIALAILGLALAG